MIRLMVACAVCLACIGCGDSGPPLGRVSGTVTMDGKPLANALVVFSPTEGGRSSTGKTDAGGKYELSFLEGKGALLGSHKVSVTTLQDASQAAAELSSDDPAYAQQGSAADYENAVVKEAIPARYNSATELTKEVASGVNTIDLELTSS